MHWCIRLVFYIRVCLFLFFVFFAGETSYAVCVYSLSYAILAEEKRKALSPL